MQFSISVLIWITLAALFSATTVAMATTTTPATVAATESRADEASGDMPLSWRRLPDLPDAAGVAGAMAGSHNGALIVAGGCNFPDAPPWSGGTKTYYDTIYVLRPGAASWELAGKLRSARAYGVSVTTNDGVFLAGGHNADAATDEAVLLKWVDGKLQQVSLPPLPMAITQACGAAIGSTIYIAGGTSSGDALAADALNGFWSIDLAAIDKGWTKLPTWPGPERFIAVAAVQEGSFFLVSGVRRRLDDAGGRPQLEYLKDGYRYTPGSGWKRIADLPRPNAAAPSPAPALGHAHFLLLGGGATGAANHLPIESRPLIDGSSLAYHTITDTWSSFGVVPAPRVTAPVATLGRSFVQVSGETRPGVRSPEVWVAEPRSGERQFGLVNYLTLGSYPLVMLAISWAVGRKRTTDEYFRGGQRIPWWAAGISIFATMVSSITYMAVPAKAYVSDWAFFIASTATLLVAPLIIGLYLPFFRRLNVTSAYEYLELRFNRVVRWFGSLSFVALQVGRTAIVLYLPSLALATVSNLDLTMCILVMGAISILMTFMGGIESVVWTDVAQTVILMAGAIITFVIILMQPEIGVGGFVQVAQQDNKLFGSLRWDADLSAATVWVILIGTCLSNLVFYTSSQDVVQRYVTTPTQRQAARAIWTNALISMPAALLFFALGTALYVYYKAHAGRLDPTLGNDTIYPLFMVRELPAGVAGLVVAGIFAAAQPTSNLNSIATAIVTDFVQPVRPGLSDRARLRWARYVTVAFGVIGTFAALAFSWFDIRSIYDVSMSLIGVTGGVLAGLFALGMLTRRATGAGAIAGAAAGTAILAYVQSYTSCNFLLYGGVGTIGCFIAGYLASLVLPGSPSRIAGLTIYDRGTAPAA